MPLNAAKALFMIQAGVIPGVAMEEYTKQWSYSSEDREADRLVPPDQPTKFSTMLQEVHDHAMGLTNPGYVNWVQTNWIWV